MTNEKNNNGLLSSVCSFFDTFILIETLNEYCTNTGWISWLSGKGMRERDHEVKLHWMVLYEKQQLSIVYISKTSIVSGQYVQRKKEENNASLIAIHKSYGGFPFWWCWHIHRLYRCLLLLMYVYVCIYLRVWRCVEYVKEQTKPKECTNA